LFAIGGGGLSGSRLFESRVLGRQRSAFPSCVAVSEVLLGLLLGNPGSLLGLLARFVAKGDLSLLGLGILGEGHREGHR
jgi:hypothetical protein